MPRSPRRKAKQSALRKQCTTLSADSETRCNKLISSSSTRCHEHQTEYVRLTKEYKQYSELADSLESSALLTLQSVDTLQSSEDVQEKLDVVDEFIMAVYSEVKGRKSHHRRFFQDSTSLLYLHYYSCTLGTGRRSRTYHLHQYTGGEEEESNKNTGCSHYTPRIFASSRIYSTGSQTRSRYLS